MAKKYNPYLESLTKRYPIFVFPLHIVEVDEEIHCDYCMEIVHFHINPCPCCGKSYAETDQFHSVREAIEEEKGYFQCIEYSCKSGNLLILSHDSYEEELEVLKLNYEPD